MTTVFLSMPLSLSAFIVQFNTPPEPTGVFMFVIEPAPRLIRPLEIETHSVGLCRVIRFVGHTQIHAGRRCGSRHDHTLAWHEGVGSAQNPANKKKPNNATQYRSFRVSFPPMFGGKRREIRQGGEEEKSDDCSHVPYCVCSHRHAFFCRTLHLTRKWKASEARPFTCRVPVVGRPSYSLEILQYA